MTSCASSIAYEDREESMLPRGALATGPLQTLSSDFATTPAHLPSSKAASHVSDSPGRKMDISVSSHGSHGSKPVNPAATTRKPLTQEQMMDIQNSIMEIGSHILSEVGPCTALVRYKRGIIRSHSASMWYLASSYVIVEGDRGTDLGQVIFVFQHNNPQCRTPKVKAFLQHIADVVGPPHGHIHRIATPPEIQTWRLVLPGKEAQAVQLAQGECQRRGLPMKIVDAVYQFDTRKITFFFEASERVEFNALVKDLYRTFNARIWMQPADATTAQAVNS